MITIEIPNPLRKRCASSHWTAGLSVPTMTSAPTRTRTAGRSRVIAHDPTTMSTMVIMVEGERSKRTTRFRRIGIDFSCRILSSSFAEPGVERRLDQDFHFWTPGSCSGYTGATWPHALF